MRKPTVRPLSAEETSALFYRARKTPSQLRSEAKIIIALTVFACLSLLILYKALFSI